MNILVCVKSVPETAEADLEVTDEGDAVETDELVFGINEWDNFAVEEAVRLKEARGGQITAVTLSHDEEEGEALLRRALAMGVDEAILICDEGFEGSDAATVAEALARAVEVREVPFDLILTGVQSADLGQGQTGPLLAQRLGLPLATLAVKVEVQPEGRLLVTRELEANTLEEVELGLPALVTVQSGINQPRYVSILGIRKVRSKTIDEVEAEDLELEEAAIGAGAAAWTRRELAPPPAAGRAELLEGSLREIGARAAQILREKGGR